MVQSEHGTVTVSLEEKSKNFSAKSCMGTGDRDWIAGKRPELWAGRGPGLRVTGPLPYSSPHMHPH